MVWHSEKIKELSVDSIVQNNYILLFLFKNKKIPKIIKSSGLFFMQHPNDVTLNYK